jgi:hypothetical protein
MGVPAVLATKVSDDCQLNSTSLQKILFCCRAENALNSVTRSSVKKAPNLVQISPKMEPYVQQTNFSLNKLQVKIREFEEVAKIQELI